MAAKKQVDLTEAQKQCLRLVVLHYTSKEIARQLGVSHYTVDQRLDIARRKLNADSRINAAKIFAALEGRSISDALVYEPAPVASGAISAKQRASNIEEEGNSNQQQIIPIANLRSGGGSRMWLALPPLGGSGHQLSKGEVFVAVIKTATFSTVAISAVVITIVGLMRILT
jgi:DNA-binding CsgD family transcriptional regulator